jgi:hypothetical protein
MIYLLLKIFGDPNDRKIKKIQPVVDYINSLEPEISRLTDDELRGKITQAGGSFAITPENNASLILGKSSKTTFAEGSWIFNNYVTFNGTVDCSSATFSGVTFKLY